jgi:hypothetical protein
LRFCGELTHLDLEINHKIVLSNKFIENNKKIKILNISGCWFQNNFLRNQKELYYLNASHCDFKNVKSDFLENARNLEILILDYCKNAGFLREKNIDRKSVLFHVKKIFSFRSENVQAHEHEMFPLKKKFFSNCKNLRNLHIIGLKDVSLYAIDCCVSLQKIFVSSEHQNIAEYCEQN